MDKSIKIAKQVIRTEIKGLESLLPSINQNFTQIIEQIIKAEGKVILSGMGKSGHIAQKIASTLSSMGTSAFFIHPSETSHGDLGMIDKNDLVIIFSLSGQTKEIKDIINYCNRLQIILIGITGDSASYLASLASYRFILPKINEATKLQAPTTSTTMMLALGDAIAITLAELKNFSETNYNIFHPGGKLGKVMSNIKSFMHQGDSIPLINQDLSMAEVIITMNNKRFGCVGIIDENKHLIGVITDGDLRRHMNDDIINKRASQVMSINPITIDENQLILEAINTMNKKKITSLFVTKDSLLVGIIHIHDCLAIEKT